MLSVKILDCQGSGILSSSGMVPTLLPDAVKIEESPHYFDISKTKFGMLQIIGFKCK
jgi:hypothetical protein